MKNILLLGCASALCAASTFSIADDWTGKGELGFVDVSGNTESRTLNAALTMEKITEQWKHIAKFSALQSSNDGDDKSESYSAGWRSEYSFNERSYGFGDIRYFDDKFDSFDEIYTAAIGAGYRVILEDDIKWNVSAGIGYRDTTLNTVTEEVRAPITNVLISPRTVTHEDISGATLLLESDYKHKLSETTNFENYTRIEPTSDNTFAQNVAGLSVSINSALALKVSYDVRYNTDPAKGSKSSDRITSVNIVYSF